MNSEVVWITIAANALFLVITIGNTWALAIYNKKPKATEVKNEGENNRGRTRRSRIIMVLSCVSFVVSIAILVALMRSPSPNELLNTLGIAVSVGSSVFSAISVLLLTLTDRLYAVVETVGHLAELAQRHHEIIQTFKQPVVLEASGQSTNKPLQPIAPKDGAPVER